MSPPEANIRDGIDDLDQRFWLWRATQAPRTRDDLPRLERPAGWKPAWSGADAAGYERSLEAFDREHRALRARLDIVTGGTGTGGTGTGGTRTGGTGTADRADEVDLRLIGSAIARARFEVEGIASWRRDPWFYLDQTVGTVFDLLLPPPPIDERRCAELLLRLGSFGATLAAGRENCAEHLALELAAIAHDVAPTAGADLVASLAALGPFVGPTWAARLEEAGKVAAVELGGFADWLADAQRAARPLGGVGEPLFARYLYKVALLPFTPSELLAAGRQEWDRAVGFELFEQHRVPDAMWPALPASASDQAVAEAAAEREVRRFYEERDLLSQPGTLRHYLNAPRPPYLEPLRWLGVTDDLTGPDRLDQDGVSYVPVPAPDLPYFYRAERGRSPRRHRPRGSALPATRPGLGERATGPQAFLRLVPQRGHCFLQRGDAHAGGFVRHRSRHAPHYLQFHAPPGASGRSRRAPRPRRADHRGGGSVPRASSPDGPGDGEMGSGVLRGPTGAGALVHGRQAADHAAPGGHPERRRAIIFPARVPRLALA